MTDPAEQHATPETDHPLDTAVPPSTKDQPTSFYRPMRGQNVDDPERTADLSFSGNVSSRSAPDELGGEGSELYQEIEKVIAERTRLPDSVCWLATFWVVSSWFLEAFAIYPCLILTGPAFAGMTVLKVLNDLCRNPVLLTGWRRSDLRVLAGYRTSLITMPVLNNEIASLVGSLTNRECLMVEQGGLHPFAGARAVHAELDVTSLPIQNSIFIDATMPLTTSSLVHSAPGALDGLRNRMDQYRNRNLNKVHSPGFKPSGLSPELSAIASVLGSCVVAAPYLQHKLVSLLQPTNQQAIDDRKDTWEALIVGAAIKLADGQNEEIYVKQLLTEIAPRLDALGETKKGRSERVGRRLKNSGSGAKN